MPSTLEAHDAGPIARAIRPVSQLPELSFRMGVVDTVNLTTSPPTVDCAIGGEPEIITGLLYLEKFGVPQPSDSVWLMKTGLTYLVIGKVATDGSPDYSSGGGNLDLDGGQFTTGGGNLFTESGNIDTGSGDILTHAGDINTGGGVITSAGGHISTAGGAYFLGADDYLHYDDANNMFFFVSDGGAGNSYVRAAGFVSSSGVFVGPQNGPSPLSHYMLCDAGSWSWYLSTVQVLYCQPGVLYVPVRFDGAAYLQLQGNSTTAQISEGADGYTHFTKAGVGSLWRYAFSGGSQLDIRFGFLPNLTGTDAVLGTSSGQLGYKAPSSLRYKHDVTPSVGRIGMDRFDVINFRYNDGVVANDDGRIHVGFAADQVAEVDPDFVTYDEDGQVRGIRIDGVVAHLARHLYALEDYILGNSH